MTIPDSLLRLFSPISKLLTSPDVRRVVVDGPGQVLADRGQGFGPTGLEFPGDELEAALNGLARRAGKPFDVGHPCLEAMLKDGTRFLALREPVVQLGPVLAVTLPEPRTAPSKALLEGDAGRLLRLADAGGMNVAVVGPVGSGRLGLACELACELAGRRVGLIDELGASAPEAKGLLRLIPRSRESDGLRPVTVGDLLYCAGRLGLDRVISSEVKPADAWDTLSLLAGRAVPVTVVLPGLAAMDGLLRLDALARGSAPSQRERAVAGLVTAGLDLVATLGWFAGRRRVVEIALVKAEEGLGLTRLTRLEGGHLRLTEEGLAFWAQWSARLGLSAPSWPGEQEAAFGEAPSVCPAPLPSEPEEALTRVERLPEDEPPMTRVDSPPLPAFPPSLDAEPAEPPARTADAASALEEVKAQVAEEAPPKRWSAAEVGLVAPERPSEAEDLDQSGAVSLEVPPSSPPKGMAVTQALSPILEDLPELPEPPTRADALSPSLAPRSESDSVDPLKLLLRRLARDEDGEAPEGSVDELDDGDECTIVTDVESGLKVPSSVARLSFSQILRTIGGGQPADDDEPERA